MKKSILTLLTFLLIGLSSESFAQGSDLYGKGIRINIDSAGKKYIRFITWHQMWIRNIENNPGTLVNGEEEKNTWDIGIRRSRFLWFTQISPRFLILAHFGINNQTFVNGGGSGTSGVGGYGVGKKPQLFWHDLWTEYTIVKDKLSLGAGLHYWNGVSRMSSASTLNFLALDAPIFNWPLIEETDQFARQFGIYAKGKLGKLDYRIALNKPFATPTPTSMPFNRAVAVNNNNWSASGYFSLEFLEKESNLLPFFVGTYVGTKKVFNIGAGYHLHGNATGSISETGGAMKRHNMSLFGIDAFLDMPLNKEKGTAITAYSVLYNFDFGPNYIRSIGIMNEGTPSLPLGALPQGGGNAQYTIGTGNIFHTEVGYLLPKSMLGKAGKLQPFATGTFKNFENLGESSFQWAAGFNFFMEGHHSKISLKYQTHPLYAAPVGNDKPRLNTDKKSTGEFIIQTMIFL